MAETIEACDLVVDHNYQIYNRDFTVNAIVGDSSKPIIGTFIGIDIVSGEAQFDNVIGIGVMPHHIISYMISNAPFGWITKMDYRNTVTN